MVGGRCFAFLLVGGLFLFLRMVGGRCLNQYMVDGRWCVVCGQWLVGGRWFCTTPKIKGSMKNFLLRSHYRNYGEHKGLAVPNSELSKLKHKTSAEFPPKDKRF